MKLQNIFFALFLSFMPTNLVFAQMENEVNPNNVDNPDLISPTTKVDYNNLARLLKKGEWRKANDETITLLLEATGRNLTGWVRADDVKKLSCWDLKTIDSLWKTSSDGKFGFSTQLPIYLETGNRPGKLLADNNYNEFGDRIGWRKDGDWIIFIENLNYSLNAPEGHLPNPRSQYSITGGRLQYTSLAERMIQCHIMDK